jgi:hypothetical protein
MITPYVIFRINLCARLDPDLFYAWTNKSNALYALGRTTEASAAIAKAADVRDAAFAKAKELGYSG